MVPEPPSRDTNSHDDTDNHLGEEDEEEEKEIEGAVTPGRRKKTKTNILKSCGTCDVIGSFQNEDDGVEPEGFIHGAVPTHEGAGRKEDGPEDGEAQADAAAGGVHAEHGQGGDHVEEQRGSTD